MPADPSGEPFPFARVPDPLYRRVPLDHAMELPVLGIRTRFESNAARIMEIVDQAFGGWRSLEQRRDLLSPEAARVALIVHPGDEGGTTRPPVTYRMPDGERVYLSTPGSVGVADPARRESVAYVTPVLVGDAQHFRYSFVEALTFALLSTMDRQPYHAAALAHGDAALLLAGPSGVGKSTLVYAAARAGLAVMSEDIVFLQRRPATRVWGLSRFLHLLPDAGLRFPELNGRAPVLQATGEEKLCVDLEQIGAMARLPVVDRTALCILARGRGAPVLRRLGVPEAENALSARIESGFDLFADSYREGVRRLAHGGAWRLEMGEPDAPMIPLLHRMLAEIPAG